MSAWASSAYVKLDNDVFTEKAPKRPITNNVFKMSEDSMVTSTFQNVVGGAPSASGDFPYNVLFSSPTAVCAGVLIHPDIILTTVSCTAAETSDARIGGINTETGVVISVAETVEHPDYDAATAENDLRIVRLSTTTNITPVPLATTVPAVASSVTAIGFGVTAEDGTASTTLQDVDITVLDFINCENFLDATVFPASQICAGNLADGRGHCDQDEGGALLAGSTLVGLFSFNEACGEADEPSVYTNIVAYLDFIEATICDISTVPPEDCESAAPTVSPAPSVSSAPSSPPTSSVAPTVAPQVTTSPQPTTTSQPSGESGPSLVPTSMMISETPGVTTEPTITVAPTLTPSTHPPSDSSGKGKGKGKGKKGKKGKKSKKGKGSSSYSGKGKGKGNYYDSYDSSGKGKGKGGKGDSYDSYHSSGKGKGKKGKGGSDSSDRSDSSVDLQGRNEAVPLYKLTRQQRRRRRRRRRFGNK
jgi:hypothetical protein